MEVKYNGNKKVFYIVGKFTEVSVMDPYNSCVLAYNKRKIYPLFKKINEKWYFWTSIWYKN